VASIEIDHVIVAVDHLDHGAARLRADHGLASIPGGRHPGHGTGNMIVPLAGCYLELMAVVDRAEASGSELGRFVTEIVDGGGGPMALCLRTDDMAATCRARGLQQLAMGRERPDGVRLDWEVAGLAEMLGADRLPFFIQWHVPPGNHPAEARVDHPGGPAALERVVLGGDGERIASWIGETLPGIDFAPSPPGVAEIHMLVGGHPVVITR
jgi:Glyoxalase-like domain